MLKFSRLRAAGALLLLVGTLSVALACSEDEGPPADVVATTVQIGALTKEVAGGALVVHTLVGPGVDPHDFEADSGDLKQIGRAKVILRNGIGLDDFLDRAIESGGGTNVVTVTEGIALREGAGESDQEDEEEGDGDGHGDEDPHVWHNPLNAKVMVDHIVTALVAAFPDQADTFRKNGDDYKATLDDTDRQIKALIDAIPVANRKVVTNHDAFGYFIERYGLTYVGAVIPSVTTAGEASSKDLAALQDTIKREGVKAIFAESSLDPKVAREIARDTNVKIVDDLYGDSLGEPGSDAATVHGMLLANARKVADALK